MFEKRKSASSSRSAKSFMTERYRYFPKYKGRESREGESCARSMAWGSESTVRSLGQVEPYHAGQIQRTTMINCQAVILGWAIERDRNSDFKSVFVGLACLQLVASCKDKLSTEL